MCHCHQKTNFTTNRQVQSDYWRNTKAFGQRRVCGKYINPWASLFKSQFCWLEKHGSSSPSPKSTDFGAQQGAGMPDALNQWVCWELGLCIFIPSRVLGHSRGPEWGGEGSLGDWPGSPSCPTVPAFSGNTLCFSPQVAAESLPPSDWVQVPKSIGEQGKNVQAAGAAGPLEGLGPSPSWALASNSPRGWPRHTWAQGPERTNQGHEAGVRQSWGQNVGLWTPSLSS